MNIETGEIKQAFELDGIREKMIEAFKQGNLGEAEKLKSELGKYVPMNDVPTKVQMVRKPPKVGRNEKCPCGSGKKFKRCHLLKDKILIYRKKVK